MQKNEIIELQRLQRLQRLLGQSGISFYQDIPLAPFTTFAIGGNAQLLVLPRTREELFLALQHCWDLGLGLRILGGGANVLVHDSGVSGVLLGLRLLRSRRWEAGPPRLLYAESGWDMSALCRWAQENGAGGLHFFYGMPGSLGGAVYMNARCYGGEISQLLRSCLYIPAESGSAAGGGPGFGSALRYNPARLQRAEFGPGDWHYKYSHFQRDSGHALAGALILEACLELRESSAHSAHSAAKGLEREMEDFREDRVLKGHYRYPSAGSFFKNNRSFGMPTGQLVDSLGLKGLRVGDAQLAPWHGNIIINTGRATAAEVWQLAREIQLQVRRRSGFVLEAEVQRLGGDWEDWEEGAGRDE